MDSQNFKIIVSGDICNNSLIWKTQQQCTQGLSWQYYPQVHHLLKPGEALLLSKLVALSTGMTVLSPEIQNSEACPPQDILFSSLELNLFPETAKENDSQKVYRVSEYLGFTGPASGTIPQLFAVLGDDENANMVIIDDENNGFNSVEEFWPSALKSPKKSPIVIYKINNPDRSTPLWKQIEKYHLENTVVVINGDDLRSKGVNISRSLSWERTALDFVWQMNNNPDLNYLAKCHHLIVPFGLEGAIYYRNEGFPQSHLYFLTYEIEGDFIKENQGKMYGLTSCFVAGLAHALTSGMKQKEELHKMLDEGIREGIVAAQKYFTYGFGKNPEEDPFPNSAIFVESEHDFIYKEQIQDVLIRNTNNRNCQSCWYIIKDKSSTNLAEIAYDIVKNGEQSALKFIPIARFGNLKVVDRTEIESYRSIKNLIGEYVSAKTTVRPLSIAVFGTPGSGKSFGVAEVASSIAPHLIEKLNFNLSQLQSVLELYRALHNVRDLSLMGKIPLVFFDEFDTHFEGKLGWLKYFLAPMQDGVFREGDSIHPIGKAIFVFAGGTSSSYQEFGGETIEDEQDYKQFSKKFQSAKGPDFISRLRGYVNILGPNQTDEQWDQLFIIRRAMLLRSLLERKVPHLINERGEAQIDSGVLRALLKVSRYKHESRSMEAILEMSTLNKAKKWEQSYLPSKEQLKLHVDEEQFSRLLMRDTFFSEKIEKLARDLHFKHTPTSEKDVLDPLKLWNMWDNLSEEHKKSLRDQIRHIPSALQKINYDLISVMEKPETIQFTDHELDVLAKYEHKRKSLKQKEEGWKWGEHFDSLKKTDPSLVPWESLSRDAQNQIIANIRPWSEILADSNFKIERLKFLCYCEVNMKPISSR